MGLRKVEDEEIEETDIRRQDRELNQVVLTMVVRWW